MIRARSRIFQAPPGFAVAECGDERFVSDGPVVSPTLWPIANITKHPTRDTFVITFKVQPKVPRTGLPPEALQIRVDAGMSLVTYAAHPLSKRIDQPIEPTASPYEFEVPGVAYEESLFLAGHCYASGEALIDGPPLVNDIFARCRAKGAPSRLITPPGLAYVRTQPLRPCEVVDWGGAGQDGRSGWCLADRADQPGEDLSVVSVAHLIETGGGTSTAYRVVDGLFIHDMSFYGNRGFQIYNKGTHAVALGGSELTTKKRNRIRAARIDDFGSSGYGWQWSGDSPHEDSASDTIRIWFPDGDGYDNKNREDQNRLMRYTRLDVRYWSMQTMGTDLEPDVALPANPITTTAGSPDFVVPRYAYLPLAAVGEICTLVPGSVSTFDGIDLAASFKCIGIAGDTVTLRGTQNAVAGGTGGGTGIVAKMPHYGRGDAAVDSRCPDALMDDIWVEGHYFDRNGTRQRGGLAGSANGLGSDRIVMNNIRGKDTTPSWVAPFQLGEAASLISLEGTGATVNNPKFEGTASSQLLRAGAATNKIVVNNGVAEGVRNGYLLQGENIDINGGVIRDWSNHGVRVHGSVLAITRDLPENPFRCKTLGAAVVVVNDPGHPLTTGQSVAFVNPQSAYGVLIERSNVRDYTVTKIDANFYEITAAGSATNIVDSFGGEEVDARYPPGDHVATNIRLRGVTFETTTPSTTAVPLALGIDLNNRRGQASDIVVSGCHVSGTTARVINYGEDVVFFEGNTGELAAYNTPTAAPSACWKVAPGGDVTIASSVSYLDFTQLDYPQIRVELEDVQKDATSNVFIQVSPDNCVTIRDQNGDYGRHGVGAGTSSIVIAGSTGASALISGAVEIANFNQVAPTTFDVSGSENNSATAFNEAPGYTTRTEALRGLRLDVTGNLTAGRVRVLYRDDGNG